MSVWTINENQHQTIFLARQDPVLGELLSLIGPVKFELRPERFQSLVRSIIGQMISVAAAEAIFNRLLNLTGHHMTPETIASLNDTAIRDIGFSKGKLAYLRDLQQKVQSGQLNLDELDSESDQTVIDQLTSIKGIGHWTAQMFLIFTLQRANVLAVDDIGLQRGARWLYEVNVSERRQCLADKEKLWRPYCTYASIYLWEAVQRGWVKQYDSIQDIPKHT